MLKMINKIKKVFRSVYFKITSIFIFWILLIIILISLTSLLSGLKFVVDFVYYDYADKLNKSIKIYEKYDQQIFNDIIYNGILNEGDSLKIYNTDYREQTYSNGEDFEVTSSQVEDVLRSDKYLSYDGFMGGIATKNNKKYAIFLKISTNSINPLENLNLSKDKSYQTVSNQLKDKINKTFFILISLTILVGILVFIYFMKSILKPIKKIINVSKEISQGNYNNTITTKRKDEIGELVDKFNYMNKELNKLEQMRQEFISNISHELKTPITSINGFAYLLEDESLSQSEKLQYLNIIQSESLRLSNLSDNLMKLAKLDSEQVHINKSKYRVDSQLRRIIVLLEPKWSEKNMEFNVNLPKIFINGDENLLDQVFINILDNAIKFSTEGDFISVNIENNNQYTIITIKDSGVGMSEEECNKIFERFYQGETSRISQGSGLGLSIVKKIIDIHDGIVKVESKVNLGTEFTIYLPLD